MKKSKTKTSKKKSTSKKNANKTLKFNERESYDFKANVKLGPGKSEVVTFTVNLKKSDGRLTYDHVEFAAYDEIDKIYPKEYFPKTDIDGFILIHDDWGDWSPVVSESNMYAIEELRKSHDYNRFLVLPDAHYSLTPEFSLYHKMVESKLIDEHLVPFDYEKMHKIMKMASEYNH